MILDVFYFLFKSDTKDAQKNVDDLGKKVDVLKDKGKKRSEQENKDLKDNIKQHKELSESLKDNETQYTKIGASIAEAAASALSFSVIAKGVFGAANSNSALQVQGKLINQNTAELKAFGAAAEQAGGSAQSIYDYANNTFQEFSSLGLGDRLPAIEKQVDNLRTKIKGLSLGQATRILNQLGIDQGARPLLFLSETEYAKAIEYNRELTKNTEKGAEVAREYAKSWSQVSQAFDSLYTSIGSEALPGLQSLNKELAVFIKYLAEGGIGKDIFDFLHPNAKIENKTINRLGERPITENDITDVKKGEKRNRRNIYDDYSQNPAKESYKIATEPLSQSFPEDAAKLTAKYRAATSNVNSAVSLATNSQIGFGAVGKAPTGDTKNITIKIGDIHVNTNASDSHGVALDITNGLKSQIYFALSNIDDGIAR